MDKQNYKPRIIDRQVEEYLSAFGAVCIEGPKWCGKTWTSSYHSKSEIYIGDPAGNFQNRQLAELSPALVLEGETPRLIDEWQEVPPLWDAVRYKVDQSAQKGQFILTGSATPNHKGILHSGAGRIARLRMRPMSLWESGDSSGKVSLEQLGHGTLSPAMTGEVDLRKLIELIIRGGWPGSLGLPLEQAALLPTQYLDAVIDDDVYRIDGIRRDTQKMRLLLRSLARNESTTWIPAFTVKKNSLLVFSRNPSSLRWRASRGWQTRSWSGWPISESSQKPMRLNFLPGMRSSAMRSTRAMPAMWERLSCAPLSSGK